MYPADAVLGPNVLLYENVSPANSTFPFIFSQANLKFVVLSVFPPSYVVLKVASWSGNASVPIWSVVTFGFVIIKSIVYWSLSSSNIFFACSISKSIPSTSGCIVNGFCV